ncbi:unnamed protein product [Owenia fusiformis]|uniref:Zinc finger MYND domain-containing protein 10 n=1 Tax=Owenia fusiformis TaxID=6347 RepID=A0A8S4NMX2_OWEFU|nr:unnamed protein product [Owenia fusiformis]
MSGENTHVLLSVEAEGYVQALEVIDLKEVGSPRWSRQHEYIEKLNMQAVVSASAQEEEFVKEYLISFQKITVLIYELLVIEAWKQNIFTQMIQTKFEPKTTFPVYMALYHEATVANLLETMLYHSECCESAEDNLLDVTDYCFRKLTHLIAEQEEKEDEEEDGEKQSDSNMTNMMELQKQKRDMEFDICIKAVSILRYITDHMSSLSLSIMSRLLNTHDAPVLLVSLIDNPPWTRRKQDGEIEKYIDNKWVTVTYEDSLKLTKTEGQVWIALFHLLMEEECQRKYELTSFRKNIIMKLRSHLTEVLVDQMPVLGGMLRYLEHLSMMDPPPVKKNLVLEQVPQIRDSILKECEGKWKSITKQQCKTFFNPPQSVVREQAKRWADTYNFDMLGDLIAEPPKCAVCGDPATKRCSRCQNEWYCRRECQVSHWGKHKAACNLMVDSMQKIKDGT